MTGDALRPGGSTRRWRRLRYAVLVRDGWACRVPVLSGRVDPAGEPCGAPADQVDHIIPRALGGTDVLENLRAACWPHNRRKGARLDADVTDPDPDRRRGPAGRPSGRAWAWPSGHTSSVRVTTRVVRGRLTT